MSSMPVAVQQDAGHVEGVRDDGEPPVDDLGGRTRGSSSRCRWRSSARPGRARPPRRAIARLAAPDADLARLAAGRRSRQRRPAVRPDERPSSASDGRGHGGSWTASRRDRGRATSTLARPSARRRLDQADGAVGPAACGHPVTRLLRTVNSESARFAQRARVPCAPRRRRIAATRRGVSMAYLLGTRRGLDACASPRGTFAVLALDHRQNLRKELRPERPGVGGPRRDGRVQAGGRARARRRPPPARSSTRRSAPPSASPTGRCPGAPASIVAVEATGYEGPPTARVSRCCPAGTVEQVEADGASAAKLLVYYHPDAANAADQERLVADVAAACRAADLALFVEPLSFGLGDGGKLTGEARRRVVVETARRLTALGGDMLKAEFPYDPRSTTRAPGATPAPSSTRRRRCRGCSCPAASTTRPSRARSRSPAGPARAACSSAGRSGPRRRR